MHSSARCALIERDSIFDTLKEVLQNTYAWFQLRTISNYITTSPESPSSSIVHMQLNCSPLCVCVISKKPTHTGATLLLFIAFFSTYSLHKLSPAMTPSLNPRLFFSDLLAKQKAAALAKHTTKPNKHQPPGKLTRSRSLAIPSLFVR